ncbi:phosphatase 2C-like domain-containing protein [Tuber borchii]|uniref:protein-serine/threonine phosphatase n=1 Tax=Tuber borchii TaxID=42251 RepID=A0A2T6ZEE1_TUBBO|nr:phosphatase 2C-like domain-containing protein [Tuber borchii]
MGVPLSQPIVNKISESGEDNRLAYGISSIQGWRVTMEDVHAAVLDLQNPDDPTKAGSEGRISFFGVYDGHTGDRVANFSGENVHKILAKQPAFKDSNYEQALKDGLLSTGRAILQEKANAGDSRTPLSFDHKPYNEEKARICATGGSVDSGRVNGNLALSKAIRDFGYKMRADLPPEQQIVTAFSDVVIHEVSDDEFPVIACDELHSICENMMEDNMTMIVVALLRNAMTKEEWYGLIPKRVADGDSPCSPPKYAKFRRPGVHPTNFGGSPVEFDIRIINSSIRAIGGAVSTDSEDGEVFDD